MPDPRRLDPQTVHKLATDYSGQPLADQHATAAAAFVTTLLADMQPLRQMSVGDAEPATTYSAAEGQP